MFNIFHKNNKTTDISFKMNIVKSNFNRTHEIMRDRLYGEKILGTYFQDENCIEIYLNSHKVKYAKQSKLEDRLIYTIEHESLHSAIESINKGINTEDSIRYIQGNILGSKFLF